MIGFIPPAAMQKIATERTEGMIGIYMYYGARTAHLPLLVRSAYMQGVNDAVDSLVQTGNVITKQQ